MPFYPTYKEWKQFRKTFDITYINAFYPTYKEWKLKIVIEINAKNPLFILPIRNGNSNLT